MSSARVLEASVRPRDPERLGDFAKLVLAAFVEDPRIDAVEKWDAVLIATIWYADLDRAVRVIDAIEREVFWSGAEIRYRYETVQSGNRTRRMTLEPMMQIDVASPLEFIGNVIGDISSRRGLIYHQRELSAGMLEVSAEVPLSELTGYDSSLASITEGHGAVVVNTLRYSEAPRRIGGDPDEPYSMALRA